MYNQSYMLLVDKAYHEFNASYCFSVSFIKQKSRFPLGPTPKGSFLISQLPDVPNPIPVDERRTEDVV